MKRILPARANTIIIGLIPALYLAFNASFGHNQPGYPDTWFYFGLAKSFWFHWGNDFINDYYETRLPYIIPAAVIFSIPSDKLASLVISYLIYCTCAFSLFYVLSKHVSKPAALLATILMASDIFFVRTVGWQYVDSGVLAYGSLTFAALTAASASRSRYAFVFLSGFFYTSMVITHLGSAPLGLAVVGYAIYVLDIRREVWRHFVALLLYAALGAMSCQVIYGLLNKYLYQTAFFFENQQIAVARLAQADVSYFKPLSSLLATGWWLSLHIGVWLAAGAMIIANFTKTYIPTKFQSYCMWAVFVTYSILLALDYFQISLFLGQYGLYVSFYLFLSYLFIGSMLPNSMRMWAALIVGGLFLVMLMLRLKFGADITAKLPTATPWAVGLALGGLLAVVGLLKNKVVQASAAMIAVVLSAPIAWTFSLDGTIYSARDVIAKAAGGTLPYFAFSRSDPVWNPAILDLVASFTPRAWWLSCQEFPDCLSRNHGAAFKFKGSMFVVSSNSDSAQISDIVFSAFPDARLSGVDWFGQPMGSFAVYRFDVPKMILIPGSHLPSLTGKIEGDARAATEGAPSNHLTFGPYVALDRGRYEVTIKYVSEGEAGSWDIVSGASGEGLLANGNIPDTGGKVADIVATIDLPNGAKALEARTLYSGHGRLSVLSLTIRPVS